MKVSHILCGAAALLVAAGTASAQWSEDFESYPLGPLGSGGWSGWDGDSGVYGTVTDANAHGGTQSLSCSGVTDAVHPFSGYTAGQWTFSGYVWVPSNLDGPTYWLIQNVYADFGPYDWGCQLVMDPIGGTVNEDMQEFYGDGVDDGFTYLDLITDQWVEVRCEIDLDAASGLGYVETYYDGVLVSWGDWDTNGDGDVAIANLDLYAPHVEEVFHDDLSLQPAGGDPCDYADCNGDSVVNTQDFICFLGLWSASDMSADCNGDSIVNTQDFICFLNLWVGCR